MDQNLINEIQNIITSGQNFLIVTHKNPNIDSIAASLSLSQAISSLGKNAIIACPTPLTVEFSNLYEIDKVDTKIGNKNLVISLDYVEGSIEKVSYNVEGNKFNLVIQPKSGFPPFSSEKVKYSYSGVNADAIFIVGAKSYEELENIYNENKETFENITTINIDYHKENTEYAKYNLVDINTSSCCQLVVQLLTPLGISINSDTATNLLTGIEENTNNFMAGITTAQDFEAAAYCLKLGARRVSNRSQTIEKPNFQQKPINPPYQNKQQIVKAQPSKKPPPDWLQPKIYKGGQLL